MSSHTHCSHPTMSNATPNATPNATWDTIGGLFEGARNLPPEARKSFLEAQGADDAVQQEVLSLLEASDEAAGFIDDLAAAVPNMMETLVTSPPDVPLSTPPAPLPTGTRLRDEYVVREVLGRGGFGITYRAHDERLDIDVAVKEYAPRHLFSRPEGQCHVERRDRSKPQPLQGGLNRFMQEGRRLARFQHRNIVNVRSYFEAHGTGYLVMDYYAGQTLTEELTCQGGRLSEADALAMMQDILDGLSAVHAEGLLHRDISPQNIYRTDEDRYVLLDFGAARMHEADANQELTVVVKPGYTPREQYHPDGWHGPHTDVYACAATLYRCLTGFVPPEAPQRTDIDVLPPHQMDSAITPQTSQAVIAGLALDPHERPASAAGFAQRLSASPDAPTTADGDRVSERHFVQASAPAMSNLQADTGPWDRWGLAAIVTALVGGLFLPQGTFSGVLALLGTWAATAMGLLVLFREGERVMRPESRAALSDWLLQEDFVVRSARWPDLFVRLFDAVFTEEHLSWQCFRRSVVASVVFYVIVWYGVVTAGWFRLNIGAPNLEGTTAIFVFSGGMMVLNVFIDYVSLFETRWILGRMRRSASWVQDLGFLGVDLLLTTLIFIVTLFTVQTLLALSVVVVTGLSTPPTLTGLLEAYSSPVEIMTNYTTLIFGPHPGPYSIGYYTTLFTSVWAWLYVLAGAGLRLLTPLLRGLDGLKAHFDLDARPVYALGLGVVVLVSLLFAVSVPFVL